MCRVRVLGRDMHFMPKSGGKSPEIIFYASEILASLKDRSWYLIKLDLCEWRYRQLWCVLNMLSISKILVRGASRTNRQTFA